MAEKRKGTYTFPAGCGKLFRMEKRDSLRGLLFALTAVALFAAAILIAFLPVLDPDTVFLAPDAPILPLAFSDRIARFLALPTLQDLILLLPYGFSYEGTFWIGCGVLGLAAFLILRAQGLSREGAAVGAFSAAFLGYSSTLFCAGHRGVVDALAMTALAGGCFATGIRSLRWSPFILGAICCAAGLGAQADIWFLTMVPVSLYALYLWVRCCPCKTSAEHSRCFACGRTAMLTRTRTLLLRFLAAGAVFLAAGFPALRHTFRNAQETRTAQLTAATAAAVTPEERVARHREFLTDWSLPPEDLLEWINPHANGHTSYPFDPDPYRGRMGSATQVLRQHAVHVGWYTLALALAAWFRKRDPTTRDRGFWTLLAVITLLFAFGRYTPLYRPLTALPFFDAIRAPVKWLHLTGFSLAILAGIGAEPICRKWGRPAAMILAALICWNGILVIRPYIFPVSLHRNALLRPIPAGASLYSTVYWPHLTTLCNWHRIPLAARAADADYLVIPLPQPGHTPIAELTVQGKRLGLFPLRSHP